MSAAEILKKKVNALMAKRGWTSNKPIIEASAGRLSNGTLGRIRGAGDNVGLAQIDELARVFNVEPHELLQLPPDDGPGPHAAEASPDYPSARGVVWHTQGGGKTAALANLMHFAEMARRRMPEPQLQPLAKLVSSMFEGAPVAATAAAIDAYTPQLDDPDALAAQAGPPQPNAEDLIAAARRLADTWRPADRTETLAAAERQLLLDFLAAAEQLALDTHQAKSHAAPRKQAVKRR